MEWEDRPIDLDEYDDHWQAVREASDELDIDEREDDE